MRNSIHFYSDGIISKESLTALSKILCLSVASDKKTNEPPFTSHNVTGGAFPHEWEINFPGNCEIGIKQTVGMLKEASVNSNSEILTEDESQNPFAFIHISPTGNAVPVTVNPELLDQSNALEIEGSNYSGLGTLAFTKVLTSEEITLILSISKLDPHPVSLQKIPEKLVLPEFQSYKFAFPSLAPYQHFHLLASEQSGWISVEDKSKQLLDIARQIATKLKIDIVAFPANGTIVVNVPGGSDTESFCWLVTSKFNEKIIYKTKRKSWI